MKSLTKNRMIPLTDSMMTKRNARRLLAWLDEIHEKGFDGFAVEATLVGNRCLLIGGVRPFHRPWYRTQNNQSRPRPVWYRDEFSSDPVLSRYPKSFSLDKGFDEAWKVLRHLELFHNPYVDCHVTLNPPRYRDIKIV